MSTSEQVKVISVRTPEERAANRWHPVQTDRYEVLFSNGRTLRLTEAQVKEAATNPAAAKRLLRSI